MSKFSGKCDFYDNICIYGIDRILKAKVYLGSSDSPLELNSVKDCIPYYPHIVSVASYNNNGIDVIRLTSKSWVDIEEEKYGKLCCSDHYRRELQNELDKYSEEK